MPGEPFHFGDEGPPDMKYAYGFMDTIDPPAASRIEQFVLARLPAK